MITLTYQIEPNGCTGASLGQVTRDGPVMNTNDCSGRTPRKAKLETTPRPHPTHPGESRFPLVHPEMPSAVRMVERGARGPGAPTKSGPSPSCSRLLPLEFRSLETLRGEDMDSSL